jgi:membrane protease YdiL (CAAX protease family)
MLLLSAVLPALIEEWMCRGALWVALRPIAARGTTILTTAALFATLHGLNGGFVLELPHRFVMGLLLGWLRARSASLWPCVLAHFLHNATVVVVFAD